MTQTRRSILNHGLATLSLAAFGLPSIRHARAMEQAPLVVVELFTSQGCNSCPPAEALLADLAGRPDILALEYHVDYWDYIGWADPFADPRFTQRQRVYNGIFGSPYNYTPQMVIDGQAHEVGSRRSAVEARIETAAMKRMMAARDGEAPMLHLTRRPDGGVALTLTDSDRNGGAVRPMHRLYLVGYDARHETEVLRGENSGKKLINAHVVRHLEDLGHDWRGGSLELMLTPDQIAGVDGCAILVQDPETGAIAAAADMAI